MKKSIHYLLSYFAILAILTSCQTSSEFNSSALVKKRKYTKGYHLILASVKYDKPSSAKEKPSNEMAEAAENVHPEIAIDALKFRPTPKFERLTASTKAATKSPSERIGDIVRADASFNIDMKQNRFVTKRDRSNFNSGSTVYHSERTKKMLTAVPMQSASGGFSLLLYVILAIIIPPVAVGLLYGISGPFWLSLILWFLFIIPGVIYALIKVFQKA